MTANTGLFTGKFEKRSRNGTVTEPQETQIYLGNF